MLLTMLASYGSKSCSFSRAGMIYISMENASIASLYFMYGRIDKCVFAVLCLVIS